MLRSIADITTFCAPFENRGEKAYKCYEASRAFGEYLLNAGMPLQIEELRDKEDGVHVYEMTNQESISIVWRLNTSAVVSMRPMLHVSYRLDTQIFEKDLIELFLDDGIKCVSNILRDDFFLDSDRSYALRPYNSGKVVAYETLAPMDYSNIEPAEQKRIFDALCHLRYTLQ
jgi:hypothetical protein